MLVRGRCQQEPKYSCSVLKHPHGTTPEGTDGPTLAQQGCGEVVGSPTPDVMQMVLCRNPTTGL